MAEYDCITTPIRVEEIPSTSSEDSLVIREVRPFIGSYRSIIPMAILAFAPFTASLGGMGLVDERTTTSPTKMEFYQKVERVGKRISLKEACRMADELQARIDAEYDKELERDAKIRAVWE
jgi:hypothetical protein